MITIEDVARAISHTNRVHADSRAANDLLAVIATLLLEIRDELQKPPDAHHELVQQALDEQVKASRGVSFAELVKEAGIKPAGPTIGEVLESGVVARRAAEGKVDS